MAERTIRITGKYLQIPVRMYQKKTPVHFYCDGEKILELAVCVGDEPWDTDEFDYYGQIRMEAYQGKEIRIQGDVPAGLLAKINCADAMVHNPERRPKYHFTANYGWMNDPNGLIYQDGIYHLYYQHDPVDADGFNMSWGHAISTDLLHWTYKDVVLLPEEGGMICSGSAMANEHGALGYPNDALIACYTVAGSKNIWSAGKKFVQKLAVSCDGGDTFTVLKEGIMQPVAAENRDPCVFWHEESQAYVMLLWLEKNDFGFFRSTDLLKWEQTQRCTLPGGFECPGIKRLYTEDKSEYRWVVMEAGGRCYIGSFDGYRFVWDGEVHHLYNIREKQDTRPYAAQAYAGIEDRCVVIPWLLTKDKGKHYRGSAGLPKELYLAKTPEVGFAVCQKPVAEYEAIKSPCDAETATEAEILISGEEAASISIRAENGSELPICYQPEGILTVGEKQYRVQPNETRLRILTDDRIVELFLGSMGYIVDELEDGACGFAAGNVRFAKYFRVS